MKHFAVRMSINFSIVAAEESPLPDYSAFMRDYIIDKITNERFEQEILKEWFSWYLNENQYHYAIKKTPVLDNDFGGAFRYDFIFHRVILFKSNCKMWPKNLISKEINQIMRKNAKILYKFFVKFDDFIIVEAPKQNVISFLSEFPKTLLNKQFQSRMFI